MYLQLPDVRQCLGSARPTPEASHTEYCFPDEKPKECPDESWTTWTVKYSEFKNGPDNEPGHWPSLCSSYGRNWILIAATIKSYLVLIYGVTESVTVPSHWAFFAFIVTDNIFIKWDDSLICLTIYTWCKLICIFCFSTLICVTNLGLYVGKTIYHLTASKKKIHLLW